MVNHGQPLEMLKATAFQSSRISPCPCSCDPATTGSCPWKWQNTSRRPPSLTATRDNEGSPVAHGLLVAGSQQVISGDAWEWFIGCWSWLKLITTWLWVCLGWKPTKVEVDHYWVIGWGCFLIIVCWFSVDAEACQLQLRLPHFLENIRLHCIEAGVVYRLTGLAWTINMGLSINDIPLELLVINDHLGMVGDTTLLWTYITNYNYSQFASFWMILATSHELITNEPNEGEFMG